MKTAMYQVRTYNALSSQGSRAASPADTYQVSSEDCAASSSRVCCAAKSLHTEVVPDSPLLAVARAGAGANNIPTSPTFTEQGIVVFQHAWRQRQRGKRTDRRWFTVDGSHEISMVA